MEKASTVTLQDRLISLAIVAAVIVLGWWFLFGRGDGALSSPEPPSAQSYVDEYGGSLTAIQAILRSTDCAVLGRTFTDADANREAFGVGTARSQEQVGRMAAADDRMYELGCP